MGLGFESQQDHASNLGAGFLRFTKEIPRLFVFDTIIPLTESQVWFISQLLQKIRYVVGAFHNNVLPLQRQKAVRCVPRFSKAIHALTSAELDRCLGRDFFITNAILPEFHVPPLVDIDIVATVRGYADILPGAVLFRCFSRQCQ